MVGEAVGAVVGRFVGELDGEVVGVIVGDCEMEGGRMHEINPWAVQTEDPKPNTPSSIYEGTYRSRCCCRGPSRGGLGRQLGRGDRGRARRRLSSLRGETNQMRRAAVLFLLFVQFDPSRAEPLLTVVGAVVFSGGASSSATKAMNCGSKTRVQTLRIVGNGLH